MCLLFSTEWSSKAHFKQTSLSRHGWTITIPLYEQVNIDFRKSKVKPQIGGRHANMTAKYSFANVCIFRKANMFRDERDIALVGIIATTRNTGNFLSCGTESEIERCMIQWRDKSDPPGEEVLTVSSAECQARNVAVGLWRKGRVSIDSRRLYDTVSDSREVARQ